MKFFRSALIAAIAFLGIVSPVVAQTAEPGRWFLGKKRVDGVIIGGGNLVVSPLGNVSGRGFGDYDGVTRISGKIHTDGTFKIIERGSAGRWVYEGTIKSPVFLASKTEFTRRINATKIPGNAKAGVYYGSYSMEGDERPFGAVVYPDGRLKFFLKGHEFERIPGALSGGRILIDEGKEVEATGRIRGDRMGGQGQLHGQKFNFRAALL